MHGRWTKSALLLMALTLPVTVLSAQQRSQPAEQAAAQTAPAANASATRPQLTVAQKRQIRYLRRTARDQAAIIRHDRSLTPEQKARRLRELRASTREKVKAVLTPEQREQIKQMRAARRHRMAEELGLTAEQRGKLRQLARSTRHQRRSVLNDGSLTNDQKLAKLRQIRQLAKTQLASILTPEQMAKMRQMRRQRGHRMRMHMHMR